MTPPAADRPVPTLSVPDIRDYDRINAELVQRLGEGHPHVRLVGAEGQRLLAAGLVGPWEALVEVQGRAGPEFAAELDAPGLTVVCQGPVAEGAARCQCSGRVIILGMAGPALGYAQEGGTILGAGGAGPRAGLNQKGGTLVLVGPVGRLAAERQTGGHVVIISDHLGPHSGRGRLGGVFVRIPTQSRERAGVADVDASFLRSLMSELRPWLPPDASAFLET